MISPLNSERLIGGVIALFGIIYSAHTLSAFDLGTFRRIGPGMFPLGLGITITILGIAIAIVAPDADRENPDFSPRSLFLGLIGIVAFAVAIAYVGLFPAVILCTLIASLAERPYKPLVSIGVAVILCVAAWLIFRVGLDLPIPMLRWPF